jgi:hypothetical protein
MDKLVRTSCQTAADARTTAGEAQSKWLLPRDEGTINPVRSSGQEDAAPDGLESCTASRSNALDWPAALLTPIMFIQHSVGYARARHWDRLLG